MNKIKVNLTSVISRLEQLEREFLDQASPDGYKSKWIQEYNQFIMNDFAQLFGMQVFINE